MKNCCSASPFFITPCAHSTINNEYPNRFPIPLCPLSIPPLPPPTPESHPQSVSDADIFLAFLFHSSYLRKPVVTSVTRHRSSIGPASTIRQTSSISHFHSASGSHIVCHFTTTWDEVEAGLGRRSLGKVVHSLQ